MDKSIPDVVAIIDDVVSDRRGGMSFAELQRARDEIVALRQKALRDIERIFLQRAEALEEAALLIEQIASHALDGPYRDIRLKCAAAIRALKDKHDD